MPCPYTDELHKYLNEELPAERLKEIEAHIDECPDCQKKLDSLLEEDMQLRQQQPEITDEVLVEKIKAHRRGVRRIRAYGVLGFLLGVFSRNYTSDGFIITKAIMALPYKLAEFMLSIFFSGNELNQGLIMQYRFRHRGMGFFPYHPILGFIVELITPGLVAMFLGMLIGYLISDNRVFQRKKILRFILTAAITFAIWFGAVYGFYGYTMSKIEAMEGIKALTLYDKQEFSSSMIMTIDHNNLNKNATAIMQGIGNAEAHDGFIDMNYKEGLEIILHFSNGGEIVAHIDTESGGMYLQSHKWFRLSEDTRLLLIEATEEAKK